MNRLREGKFIYLKHISYTKATCFRMKGRMREDIERMSQSGKMDLRCETKGGMA